MPFEIESVLCLSWANNAGVRQDIRKRKHFIFFFSLLSPSLATTFFTPSCLNGCLQFGCSIPWLVLVSDFTSYAGLLGAIGPPSRPSTSGLAWTCGIPSGSVTLYSDQATGNWWIWWTFSVTQTGLLTKTSKIVSRDPCLTQVSHARIICKWVQL